MASESDYLPGAHLTSHLIAAAILITYAVVAARPGVLTPHGLRSATRLAGGRNSPTFSPGAG